MSIKSISIKSVIISVVMSAVSGALAVGIVTLAANAEGKHCRETSDAGRQCIEDLGNNTPEYKRAPQGCSQKANGNISCAAK